MLSSINETKDSLVSENVVAPASGWPDAELTLQRPLRHFASDFGLRANVPEIPSSELIVHLLLGDGVSALIREVLGEQFKNFENAMRGKTKPRKNIQQRILDKFDQKHPGSSQWLNIAAKLERKQIRAINDVLLPDLLDNVEAGIMRYVRWGENSRQRLHPLCPHCNQPVKDPVSGWRSLGIILDRSSAHFADWLLELVVFLERIVPLVAVLTNSDATKCSLSRLLQDGKTPQGHWLTCFLEEINRKNLPELQIWLNLKGISHLKNEEQISYELLRKWSCSKQIIPTQAINEMLESVSENSGLSLKFGVYRLFSFICSFVEASVIDVQVPTQKAVQTAVRSRFEFLVAIDKWQISSKKKS